MANTDRPNGFTPVKTFSGRSVNGLLRAYGVADGEDIFINDFVNLESGLLDPAATNDSALAGSVVGFAKKGTFDEWVSGGVQAYANPANLEQNWYDDSANTHTDWVAFIAPADDTVYEAQTATTLTLLPGSTCDLADAAGSSTTGLSAQELTTNSNADFTVVEVPRIVGNTPSSIWGRYWVMVTRAEQAFHG